MSALDRLKCIQNNFRQQWHGINCEISGRPGKSSITLYFFRFSPSLTVVARKDEIDLNRSRLYFEFLYLHLEPAMGQKCLNFDNMHDTSLSHLSLIC